MIAGSGRFLNELVLIKEQISPGANPRFAKQSIGLRHVAVLAVIRNGDERAGFEGDTARLPFSGYVKNGRLTAQR
ncbi:MAG: hypothetical protein N3G20_05070 [Verrucomicrobiae bacterium]|nr:hypothetical protein [Verrucomicrobiae bacterium]